MILRPYELIEFGSMKLFDTSDSIDGMGFRSYSLFLGLLVRKFARGIIPIELSFIPIKIEY